MKKIIGSWFSFLLLLSLFNKAFCEEIKLLKPSDFNFGYNIAPLKKVYPSQVFYYFDEKGNPIEYEEFLEAKKGSVQILNPEGEKSLELILLDDDKKIFKKYYPSGKLQLVHCQFSYQ